MTRLPKQFPAAKILVAALAAIVALSACERGPIGIFASIEQEVEIQEGNLLKNSPINGMVEADGYYFAAVGGRIRYRPIGPGGDESDWSSLSNPSPYRADHSRPTSIVHIDPGGAEDTIYVSFVEGERKSSGLYTLDPASRDYTTAGQISADNHVARLFALGNELFASIQYREEGEDPEFELWYLGSGDTATLTGAVVLTTVQQPRRFISAATDGTNYWFITTDTVFHTDSFVAGSLSDIGKPAGAGTSLGGIYVHAGDLYLSSRSGTTVSGGSTGYISRDAGIASPDSAAAWSTIVNTGDRAFTDFAFAGNINAFGGPGVLLLGTYRTLSGRSVVSPGGYVELRGPDFDSPQRPAGNSYQTSELSKTAVMSFFIPGSEPDTIFALTGGRGLWRGVYDDEGVATWIWE